MAVKKRPQAIEELDKCIQNIRELLGFDRPLRALTPEQMQKCAADSCIVVVNINNLRSNAIAISLDKLRAIPLPDLDGSRSKSWVNRELTKKAYRDFLISLWHRCVKSVLDELRYQRQSLIECLPRI